MPYAINGFGTRLYGKRDFRADGSYLTTQFVSALWIPLIPFGSMRILPLSGVNVVVFSNMRYAILEKLPLNWKQVLCVWGFAASIVAVLSWQMWIPLAFIAALPYGLRYLARKRIPRAAAAAG
jgi:hypothetical protein